MQPVWSPPPYGQPPPNFGPNYGVPAPAGPSVQPAQSQQTQWGYPAVPLGGSGSLPPFHSESSINQGSQASPYQQAQTARPNAEVPPAVPNRPHPETVPFRPSGRKRALLVGCNYRGARFELRGCINDALCMRHLLKKKFGFRDEDIMLLTDDQPNPQRWPTRANMIYQMQMLVWDLQPGDSLFFHFSGHAKRLSNKRLRRQTYRPPYFQVARNEPPEDPAAIRAALLRADDTLRDQQTRQQMTAPEQPMSSQEFCSSQTASHTSKTRGFLTSSVRSGAEHESHPETGRQPEGDQASRIPVAEINSPDLRSEQTEASAASNQRKAQTADTNQQGHGSQVRDLSGDEIDGMSETICPCDFKISGMIIDDELNRLLVNPLIPGVRLHIVLDACHSGSAMDLEFRAKFKPSRGVYWKQEYAWRPSVYKGTLGGEAFQFGASRDKQTAADTTRLSGSVSTGAATFSFIQAIEQWGTSISYRQLLEGMYHTISSLHGAVQPQMTGFLGKLLDGAMDFAGMSGQTPCLCSNVPFDMNRPLAV